MSKRRQGRAGDVFVIPIDDESVAVGQVLAERLGAALLIGIFEGAPTPARR